MSKIWSSVSSLAESSVKNLSGGAESKINLSAKTKALDFAGNLLKTQVEGQNDYPQYLQNLMDRNWIVKESNQGMTNDEIIRHRLFHYQDWRAILRIAPITSIKYAERSYSMLGRSGSRTLDAEARIQKNGQGDITDYRAGFLSVLTEIGGILFPYTPTINVTGQANWQKQNLVHSNISYYSWENSEPESYDISGDFTASNPSEALYCLAIFNFLRTITKGSGPNFGNDRVNEDINLNRYGNSIYSGMVREVPGAAPPVLYFSAYGNGMIHEVPVVVNSYSYSLPKDVDYVELILDPKNYWQPILDKSDRFTNESIEDHVISRIPTKFNLSMKLLTNINPIKYRKFSLWDYKNGEYIKPRSSKYGYNSGWTW